MTLSMRMEFLKRLQNDAESLRIVFPRSVSLVIGNVSRFRCSKIGEFLIDSPFSLDLIFELVMKFWFFC